MFRAFGAFRSLYLLTPNALLFYEAILRYERPKRYGRSKRYCVTMSLLSTERTPLTFFTALSAMRLRSLEATVPSSVTFPFSTVKLTPNALNFSSSAIFRSMSD